MYVCASHAGTQGSGVFECGVVIWWCGVVEGRAIKFDGVDVTDSRGVVHPAWAEPFFAREYNSFDEAFGIEDIAMTNQ